TSIQMHPHGYPIIISETGIYVVNDDTLLKPLKYDEIGIISYQIIRKVDDVIYMSGTNGVYREVNGELMKMEGPKLDSLTSLVNVIKTSTGRVIGSFTEGELIEINGNDYSRL